MDFFYTTELAVPVYQTVVLLMLSTISLLFGKVKLALLINYVFILYWAYFYNQDLFLNNVEGINYFLVFYFGFGLLMAILAMIGFLFRNK